MTDITTALAAVSDTSLTVEQQADAYARLRQLRREIDRILKSRPVRDLEHRLAIVMDEAGTREYGMVRMTLKSIAPRYVCNDPANYMDVGVIDAMAELSTVPEYAPWIRRVPEHLEIVTADLGKAIASGDPAARRLFNDLQRMKLRTAEGKEPVLTVAEPPAEVEAAA